MTSPLPIRPAPRRIFSRIAGGLTMLPLLALVSCGEKSAGRQGPGGPGGGGPMRPAEVSVVTVKSEPVPLRTELPGRLAGVRVAEVRARATGILLRRHFEEGAQVEEGQLLFEIDPAPLQAALQSAEASHVKAEANQQAAQARARRYAGLSKQNAVSTQEEEDAGAAAAQSGAEVLVAKAAVDTAKLNLGYAAVTAPIAGRIGEAKVTEGALVSATEATPMALIQQMDPIYFDFTQSSSEVLRMRRAFEEGALSRLADGAAEVLLLLEDGSAYAHPGKLLFSGVSVNTTTGTITLRAEFPNPDQLLLPGMFARASLEQAVNSQALTLPQRVVARNGDGTGTVMVVTADNKVEPRVVRTDRAVGNKWIISDGLKAGEQVIIEGVQKVRPGAVVKPVPFASGLAANPIAPVRPADPPSRDDPAAPVSQRPL